MEIVLVFKECVMLGQQFLEGLFAVAASVREVSKTNTRLNDWCGGTLLALHRFLTSTPLNTFGRNKRHSLHSLGAVSQGSQRTINAFSLWTKGPALPSWEHSLGFLLHHLHKFERLLFSCNTTL